MKTFSSLRKPLDLFSALPFATLFGATAAVRRSKRSLPLPLQCQTDSGGFDSHQSTVLENAVVGIVDIVSSVQISNSICLSLDFQLKQEFLAVAAKRAHEAGIVILNHTGDGFLFLANSTEDSNWQRRLVLFHEALTQDFKQILEVIEAESNERILSGLRFGVSRGRVILGCLGRNPAYYTAVGPDVNLAARLCACAKPNEMVLSQSAWSQVGSQFNGSPGEIRSHDLKGFSQSITAVHVSRRVAFKKPIVTQHVATAGRLAEAV